MKKIALSLVLLLSLSGCYKAVFDARDSDNALSFSKKPSQTVIKHIKKEFRITHLISGLVTLGDPEITRILKKEIKDAGGSEAANIVLTHELSFVDSILAGITGGIYTPTSVTIEADIVN